jgi:hypothetical protein
MWSQTLSFLVDKLVRFINFVAELAARVHVLVIEAALLLWLLELGHHLVPLSSSASGTTRAWSLLLARQCLLLLLLLIGWSIDAGPELLLLRS